MDGKLCHEKRTNVFNLPPFPPAFKKDPMHSVCYEYTKSFCNVMELRRKFCCSQLSCCSSARLTANTAYVACWWLVCQCMWARRCPARPIHLSMSPEHPKNL